MRITALIASVTFVTGLLTGWKVNGWRLEARIADLQASYALTYAEAEKAARNRETELNQDLIEIRRLRDAEVTNISNRLASALNSLRDRHERPKDGGVSKDSGTCSAASGAQLAKGDGEFLAGYSADAYRLQKELDHCVTQYNQIKKLLNKEK